LLSPHDELAVVRGLRDGDRTAWTTLYDEYSADVWRYVARLIGNDPTAVADVVQEAFLAVAGSARRFDPARGRLWPWLAGIAHHQAAAWWRQRERSNRLQRLLETGRAEIRRLLDVAQPIEDLLERRELVDLVRYVLAEIPSDYAALLTAKYLDDRSLDEMATEVGGSVDAVKSKLARARREFRAKFERCARQLVPE